MSALFGGSGQQGTIVPNPVAPPPSRTSADIQAAAATQRNRFFNTAPGVAGTSFTGGTGASGGGSNTVAYLGNVGR